MSADPKTSSISGLLFNGLSAAKPDSLPGVRTDILLLDCKGAPVLDADGKPITTSSGADSKYHFANLAAGVYLVTRNFPTDYHLSNPTVAGGSTITVTVGVGQQVTGIDIGSLYVPPAKPPTPPVVVKPPVVVPPPQVDAETSDSIHTAIRATVCDSNAALPSAKDTGFTAIRVWCSVDWTTGKINTAAVTRANTILGMGLGAILTVTPDENATGTMCPDFAAAAVPDLLKLDKRCVVQVVNEANIPTYWPKGDVAQATKVFAVPIALKLKAAGYQVATPSITWGTPSQIITWVESIFANSPAGLWTYLDGHNYATDIGNFDAVASCYRTLAGKHGVKLMCTEWSYKVGNDKFAALIPQFLAVADKYYDLHTFFIFDQQAKFNPLTPYCIAGGKLSNVAAAWKAALKSK